MASLSEPVRIACSSLFTKMQELDLDKLVAVVNISVAVAIG